MDFRKASCAAATDDAAALNFFNWIGEGRAANRQSNNHMWCNAYRSWHISQLSTVARFGFLLLDVSASHLRWSAGITSGRVSPQSILVWFSNFSTALHCSPTHRLQCNPMLHCASSQFSRRPKCLPVWASMHYFSNWIFTAAWFVLWTLPSGPNMFYCKDPDVFVSFVNLFRMHVPRGWSSKCLLTNTRSG